MSLSPPQSQFEENLSNMVSVVIPNVHLSGKTSTAAHQTRIGSELSSNPSEVRLSLGFKDDLQF